MRAIAVALAGLGLCAVLAGCRAGDPSAGDTPWNVVLALVDTLRADHLGVYGYERDTSPEIDRFARASVVFENARAQAPCTFPSVNSLLTSRDPGAFEKQLELMIGIPAKIPSLAEILGGAGYRTLAVSASVIVRKTRSSNNFFGGFDRGFEVFDEQCEERHASCVNRRAFELLDETGGDERPFFLYLHYIDPHDPYQPPADHVRRFAKPYRGARFIANGDPNPIARRVEQTGKPPPLRERDIQHLVDLYDEEIAYFDERFAELLREIAERDLAERTLVVLLSDHGEDFLERRFVKHCRSLRETQIRTPLIARIPGDPGGRRVTGAAGNIDVVPTLLDYVGVGAGQAFDGASLRPLIEGESGSNRLVFSAWGVWRSVVRGDHKLILHGPSGNARLFDLAHDPGEERDASREQPDVARQLRAALERRLSGVADREADSAERLRALGYLE